MKIAIYSDNFYPELSGISDSVITLGKNLSARGHKVDFFAPHYSAKNFSTINAKAEELDLGENIKFHRFMSFPYPTPTNQGRVVIPTGLRWRSIRKEDRPDLIHTQDFFGVGFEALAAAKFLKLPLVGTNHTPITEFTRYSPIKSKIFDKLSLRFVSWYYNKCVYVTAPSNSILEEMKVYGLKKPSQVMSNPIELKNFFPVSEKEKSGFQEKFGLSKNTVLCSGRLAPEKHVDVIIKAIVEARKEIGDITLAVTGHGSAEEELKKITNDLGAEKFIKFFGTIHDNTLTQMYQASDVYVIASTAETQSIGLMKAMATSIPSIGVRAWALPEYIKPDNGFIVEPGDYRAMAEKIIYLFKNKEIKESLGQGGFEFVKNFSEEKITDQWESLYSKVL